MKILHIVMSFHPSSSAGGPVYNVRGYSRELLHRGYQVSVCCSDRLDLKRRVEVNGWNHGVSTPVLWDGITVTYLRSFHFGYGGYGFLVSDVLWPYLNREVTNYDVVHIHGAWNCFSLVAALTAKLHGISYVIQLHDTFVIRSDRILWKKVFHRLVRTHLLDHASAVIALTVEERDDYLASRPGDCDKVFVVPSVMPPVRLPEAGQFRARWGLPDHAGLVLYLGRLHPKKGLEHLLGALPLLGRSDVRLAIVGPDAGHRATLEHLVGQLGVGDRVLFTGPIYGEAKFSAFKDADIFALPSMSEELPASALEAALCELPLILSDRCGMTQMVTEAGAGLIVPHGRPEPLADAIETLCSNPDRRRCMGRNARNMVARYCDPETVMNRLEDVYRKACL